METKNFKTELIKDMKKILNVDELGKVSTAHIIDMYCWLLTERKELPEETTANGITPKAVDKYAKFSNGSRYFTIPATASCLKYLTNIARSNKSIGSISILNFNPIVK